LSSKQKIDVIDLLDDPLGKDKNEAALIELLRLHTSLGNISTAHAWSFFSAGGVVPEIEIKAKDDRRVIRQKKIAALILPQLAGGNGKRWKKLKDRTKAHLITDGQRLCAYCRRQLYLHGYSINIDHIFPKTPMEQDAEVQDFARKLCFKLENMVICCVDCNNIKSNNRHMFHPHYSDYSDYVKYNIIISNEFCITHHEPDSRPGFNHIGEEIYKVFRLDRIEHRAILSSVGDDSIIKKIEASLILSEENEELSTKIREVYNMLVDKRGCKIGT